MGIFLVASHDRFHLSRLILDDLFKVQGPLICFVHSNSTPIVPYDIGLMLLPTSHTYASFSKAFVSAIIMGCHVLPEQ